MIETLTTLFPQKREEAWNRFLELGLPGKKNEPFRYVPLSALYKLPIRHRPSVLPQLENIPKGVHVLPLSNAFQEYKSFLTNRFYHYLAAEKNPFSLLNAALFSDGIFIYIPPHTHCEEPIFLNHIVELSQAVLLPRIHIVVGKGASAQLHMTKKFSGDDFWINSHLDIALEEKASLNFVSGSEQNSSCWHFESLRVSLKTESCFNNYAVTNGGGVSRSDYFVTLLGEGAHVSLNGLWKLKDADQHHVYAFIDHREPACTSLQRFKGVLYDSSRSSFEGKIYVHPKAQKTNAYQMNNNLIIGKEAGAHSKPNLEIFADDVKASHGTTVGRLDADALFYLKTRGIPEQKASSLLIDGFAAEILDAIPIAR